MPSPVPQTLLSAFAHGGPARSLSRDFHHLLVQTPGRETFLFEQMLAVEKPFGPFAGRQPRPLKAVSHVVEVNRPMSLCLILLTYIWKLFGLAVFGYKMFRRLQTSLL